MPDVKILLEECCQILLSILTKIADFILCSGQRTLLSCIFDLQDQIDSQLLFQGSPLHIIMNLLYVMRHIRKVHRKKDSSLILSKEKELHQI